VRFGKGIRGALLDLVYGVIEVHEEGGGREAGEGDGEDGEPHFWFVLGFLFLGVVILLNVVWYDF